jgi:carbohydrate-binding DOMON domain-containing protein
MYTHTYTYIYFVPVKQVLLYQLNQAALDANRWLPPGGTRAGPLHLVPDPDNFSGIVAWVLRAAPNEQKKKRFRAAVRKPAWTVF